MRKRSDSSINGDMILAYIMDIKLWTARPIRLVHSQDLTAGLNSGLLQILVRISPQSFKDDRRNCRLIPEDWIVASQHTITKIAEDLVCRTHPLGLGIRIRNHASYSRSVK